MFLILCFPSCQLAIHSIALMNPENLCCEVIMNFLNFSLISNDNCGDVSKNTGKAFWEILWNFLMETDLEFSTRKKISKIHQNYIFHCVCLYRLRFVLQEQRLYVQYKNVLQKYENIYKKKSIRTQCISVMIRFRTNFWQDICTKLSSWLCVSIITASARLIYTLCCRN